MFKHFDNDYFIKSISLMKTLTEKDLNESSANIITNIINRGPLRNLLVFCEDNTGIVGVEISPMPIGQLMYYRECLDVEIRNRFDMQRTKV